MNTHTHTFNLGPRPRVCACGINSDEQCHDGHNRSEHSYRYNNYWVCRICQTNRVSRYRKEVATPEQLNAEKEKAREYQKLLLIERREVVVNAYGGKCSCCGEHRKAFLTVEHVNGDGAKHRQELNKGKERGGGSMKVLRDIIKRNFPADFTILCYNCNCGRERNNGICPHKDEGHTNA